MTGTVTVGFNDVYGSDGDDREVSKTAAAALGALIDAAIANALTEGVAGGGFIALHCDVSRSETAAVTTGTRKYVRRAPHSINLTDIRASLQAPTTTGNLTLDVLVGGSSILTSLLQIDATTTTSVGSAAPVEINPADVVITDNSEISISVTSAGDGTAEGLKVDLIGVGTTVGEATMPFFVAAGNVSGTASQTNLAVPYPAGYAPTVNDVALLAAGAAANDPIRPSGWSLIGIVDHVALYWRRLDGTEGASQTFTVASADNLAGVISVWRNCVQLGNPYEAFTSNSATGSTVMTGSSITTLGPARRAVSLYMAYLGVGTETDASSPDVGWVEVYDQNDGGDLSNWQGAGSAQAAPTATTIAAESRTIVTAASPWVSFALALVPGVG